MNIHQQAVIDAAVEWKESWTTPPDFEHDTVSEVVLYAAVTRMQSAAPEPPDLDEPDLYAVYLKGYYDGRDGAKPKAAEGRSNAVR